MVPALKTDLNPKKKPSKGSDGIKKYQKGCPSCRFRGLRLCIEIADLSKEELEHPGPENELNHSA